MRLTKKQIEVAAFLHNTCKRAQDLANDFDPKRLRENAVARRLDAIARNADDAFYDLTGRPCRRVTLVELNTETPAAWLVVEKDE